MSVPADDPALQSGRSRGASTGNKQLYKDVAQNFSPILINQNISLPLDVFSIILSFLNATTRKKTSIPLNLFEKLKPYFII